LPPATSFAEAFKVADDVLKQGITGIVDLIATPSLINLDFADVSAVMKNQGLAHMGIGRARGENRMIEAVRQAVSSPLLETTIEGAKGVILNVTGGRDMTLGEVNEAARLVQGVIDYSANIIFGATVDDSITDEIAITIIATGFASQQINVEIDEKPRILNLNKQAEEKETVNYQPKVKEEKVEKVMEMPKQPEPIARPETIERPAPSKVQENDFEEDVTEKRELPAFMRKLFGKK